jgi:hypothetical protein
MSKQCFIFGISLLILSLSVDKVLERSFSSKETSNVVGAFVPFHEGHTLKNQMSTYCGNSSYPSCGSQSCDVGLAYGIKEVQYGGSLEFGGDTHCSKMTCSNGAESKCGTVKEVLCQNVVIE